MPELSLPPGPALPRPVQAALFGLSNADVNALKLEKEDDDRGTTFLDYYNGLQSGLGTATQSTARSLDAQQIVVGGLSDRRVAASGVSLDEEMTNMIKFQHAYAAASRVLSAMDENLDRLINGTGRVGL